jgi:glycerol-3-phosphate dehydrogenase (NAD(P)+)
VTLAAADRKLAETLARALGGPLFRPYVATDPIGAQIGGAVKNVIAIACGIVVGRGLGDNARAALITRGLAEIGRLAAAKGGAAHTLMGLSGLGDLTLTCNSVQSRNMSLGVALGEGRSLAEVMGARNRVAEGVSTAPSVGALARRLGVEMPICAAVERILHAGADIQAEVEGLLARPFREE